MSHGCHSEDVDDMEGGGEEGDREGSGSSSPAG